MEKGSQACIERADHTARAEALRQERKSVCSEEWEGNARATCHEDLEQDEWAECCGLTGEQ